MNRDTAIYIGGLLHGVRGSLDMIASYMKGNLSDPDFLKYRRHLAKCMAEVFEISSDIHKTYPDIFHGTWDIVEEL